MNKYNFQLQFSVILIICSQTLIGQSINQNIKLYTFQKPTMLGYYKSEKILDAKLLTSTAIDPKKLGLIDTINIKRYLTLFYPDSLETGMCVIDIEDNSYNNLQDDSTSSKFQEAQSRFISILSLIKTYRPKVRYGVYGLPFTAFYPSQKLYNSGDKFDKLFNSVDFISPSLYKIFPDSQIGQQRNRQYLNDNLSIYLSYGRRLKKPVILFIWELIHPSNKIFGGSIIPLNEFLEYVKHIVGFRLNSTSIKGLFLWNPGLPSSVYYQFNNSANSEQQAVHNRDSLNIVYYNGIIKIIRENN